MKLTTRIASRLFIALTLILTLWAGLFYAAMVDEVNDEVDDMLDQFGEQLMVRFLAGDTLPQEYDLINNHYHIRPISAQEVLHRSHITYSDSMVFIPAKHETEPARILTMIFRDEHDVFYEMVVATPTIEKQDLVTAIFGWIVFLYICLLLVLLVINLWVYHRSMRPLRRLLLWLKNYKVGQPNAPLHNPTPIIEFQQLNAAAVSNMARAEELFEEQKIFIGNASHEMQTPIAVSLGRLETLMEDETLTEHQLNEIAKTCETLEYLTRLNKALLLLFKIDNGQFTEQEPNDINALAHRLLTDLREVYGSRGVSINLYEEGRLILPMSAVLANVLVSNLLKNAFIHSLHTADATVGVRLTERSLVITNTGEAALDKTMIFNRLYQGKKREGSTGLGLALVKSVCDASNLALDYTFVDGQHTFAVSLR